jgi:hypothetical protein
MSEVISCADGIIKIGQTFQMRHDNKAFRGKVVRYPARCADALLGIGGLERHRIDEIESPILEAERDFDFLLQDRHANLDVPARPEKGRD